MEGIKYVARYIGYMAIYYQKKGDKTYVYESTSQRIKGKKNPVSTNVYLGVLDPNTGEIIPKKVRAQSVRQESVSDANGEIYALRYGPVMFLDAVQRSLHIEEDLKITFSDIYKNILATSMAQVMEPSVMDEVHITVEESVLAQLLQLRGELSPATLSKMNKDIGMSMVSMDMFFEERFKRQKGDKFAIDITSVSTYGNLKGWAEWGYNRDREKLRQVNWLLVTDSEGIPMSFQMLPGSVADITTLKFTIDSLKDKGLKGDALFDPGFESARNIWHLLSEGIGFITPSNIDTKALKRILTESYPIVKDPRNQCMLDGDRYGHLDIEIGIVHEGDSYTYVCCDEEGYATSSKCTAHVIYNPDAEKDETDSYMTKIFELRDKLESMNYNAAVKELQNKKDMMKTMTLSVEDGKTIANVNWNSVSFNTNRAGVYILLTPTGFSWEKTVDGYKLRNEVEEAYDAYKNDLDANRMNTPDPDNARGRFFVRLISLMMIVYIRRCLRMYSESLPANKRKDDKVHKMTVRELLRSLNSVMAVGNTGNWKLTHVTKANRQIFSAFGLDNIFTGKVMHRTELTCNMLYGNGEKEGSNVS